MKLLVITRNLLILTRNLLVLTRDDCFLGIHNDLELVSVFLLLLNESVELVVSMLIVVNILLRYFEFFL